MVELARDLDEPTLAEQPFKLAYVVVADRYASKLHSSRPYCGNGIWQTISEY